MNSNSVDKNLTTAPAVKKTEKEEEEEKHEEEEEEEEANNWIENEWYSLPFN